MKESTIESKVVIYAKSKGWLVYKFISSYNRGLPDRIFIRNRIIFFIEFKAPGKSPTKLQTKVHNDINFHKIDVFVVDNFDKGKELIDNYDK